MVAEELMTFSRKEETQKIAEYRQEVRFTDRDCRTIALIRLQKLLKIVTRQSSKLQKLLKIVIQT